MVRKAGHAVPTRNRVTMLQPLPTWVSKYQSSRWQKLAAVPEDQFEQAEALPFDQVALLPLDRVSDPPNYGRCLGAQSRSFGHTESGKGVKRGASAWPGGSPIKSDVTMI